MLVVALFCCSSAFAAPVDVLTFPGEKATPIGSYTAEWTAATNGQTWTLFGFNNNNNGWAFIKSGSKNGETTSTITTPAYDVAVSDIVFTVDFTGFVTSAKVDVLNGEEVVSTVDIYDQWKNGEVDAKVSGAAGNSYRLTIVNAQTTSNGMTQLSQVAVYGAGEYTAPTVEDLTAVDDIFWDFSDFTAGDIAEPTIVDNLELYGTSSKKFSIDGNEKSIDDINFTQRLKTGGSGAPDGRYIRFRVAPSTCITIYGMSGKADTERTLNIDFVKFGLNKASLTNDGNAIDKVEYEYTGTEDADVYVYSTNSGFNVYGIKVEPIKNNYTVNVSAAQNGTVETDVTEAEEGATVTVTVTPAEGYELDAINVTYLDEAGEQTVEVSADNTFVMPASDVYVGATFKAERVKNEPGEFEDTPLTKGLYKTWDGFDDYAKPTDAAPAWDEYTFGTEVGGGTVIYGNGSVYNTTYADITGATVMRITGTPGLTVRLMMNRQEDNSLTEVQPIIGEDGKVEVDLSPYPYVHLNAIKIQWGNTGAVESIILNPSDAEEKVKNEPGEFADTPLTKDLFKSWDGFDDYAKPTSTTPAWDEYTYGTEVGQGSVIYGNGSVLNSTYADITGASIIRFTGTPGLPLRVMMNRQADNSLTERRAEIGEDGQVDLDISDLPYVHVNAIKVAWGDIVGAVESIILNPSEDEEEISGENWTFDENPDDVITVTTQGYQRNIPEGSDQITGLQPVTGWTPGEQDQSDPGFSAGIFKYGSENLLNNKVAAPAAAPEGSESPSALGLSAVWGGIAQYTQPITLQPGSYKYVYVLYNGANTGAVTKNLFGFIAEDGTEYLSDKTTFPVGEWDGGEVSFTLEEETTGKLSVGFIGGGGSSNAPHLFVDFIDLEKIDEADVARDALEKAIETATASNNYLIGENLFQYPESEIQPLTDAISAAQTVYDNEEATAEEINAATETLNNFVSEFAPNCNEPKDGQQYDLTLTTAAGTFKLNIDGTANKIDDEGTPVYLVKQEDGTYAITPDNENYVVYAGGNNWTMSTSTTPYGFTFTALADGGYSITGKNGFYGTNKGDGDAAGSTVYGDKNTGNGNYIWNIAEAEDDKDPNDMTDLIVNPAYLHEGDGGTADYAGWTWSPAPGESGWKYRDFDEPMNLVTYSGNVNFSFEQTIPEVPAGQYRLSVYGFYRAGSAQDEADRVMNGDVTHNLLMFAEVGDAIFTQPIMNLYEGATSVDVTGKNNHCVVNGYNDLFVPDGASDSREFFIAGYYRNDLIVNITEAGEMKIGINHPTGMTYDSDYAPIGAWELYRIGDAEEEVTLLGDVNKDKKISIVDATMTVEFALEKATPTAYQQKAADYDESQEIDVVDAALILRAVMNFDYDAAGTKAREFVSNDYLVVNGNSIALENNDTYVAFQMDITVDGEFNGAELSARAADHHIAYNQIGENKYRVIVLSNSNSAFSGNAGELINLNVNGTYELSNIRFVDSEIRPVYIGVDNTATGINSVRALEAGAEGIYTLGGVKVNTLQKGVNIVRKADGTTVKVLVK